MFFFNDTATTEIYTLSLHDALPIYEMQATMSVIEGYSDYVMHHVGKRMVPGYEHLKERMARSRLHRPPLETAIFRITGLDMKLEQYRLGEKFADRSEERRVGKECRSRW